MIEKKKEGKRVLLIRQPFGIDLCKDFYSHFSLDILPSHTSYSMIPWKEKNHDLLLRKFYSNDFIPSYWLPSLHFIGDLSYFPLATLSSIEVSHLFHAFAYMLYQYSTSLHSSILISLTHIDISRCLHCSYLRLSLRLARFACIFLLATCRHAMHAYFVSLWWIG